MKKHLVILAFLCLLPLPAFAEPITVAGAANMQFTLEELKKEFARQTGAQIKLVIGSSGKLTSQIENGAPFDLFLSADMKYPEALYAGGFTTEYPKVYAHGFLVLWNVKKLNMSQGLKTLQDPLIRKIALPNPQVAPYGVQAVNVLKTYKLYESVRTKLVYAESIAQVNQFVTTGAADIGFTAKSAVLAPSQKGVGEWVDVDPQSYWPIDQGVVMLKYGQKKHPRDTKAFYDFLFSPAARKILEKYGYKVP